MGPPTEWEEKRSSKCPQSLIFPGPASKGHPGLCTFPLLILKPELFTGVSRIIVTLQQALRGTE